MTGECYFPPQGQKFANDLIRTGSAKDIRRRRRDSLNALEAGDTVRSSVLSLISSAPAKMNYPIMHLQHNSYKFGKAIH